MRDARALALARMAGLPLVVALLAAICFWSTERPDAHVVFAVLVPALAVLACVRMVGEREVPWWPLGLCAAYVAAVATSWTVAPPSGDGAAVIDAIWFGIVIVATCVLAGAPRDRRTLVAVLVIFLAFLSVGAFGPRSNLELYGRYMCYPAVAHWGAYPEIGLLAMLGGAGCAATALATRAWTVRVAAGGLALGFAAVPWLVTSRAAVVALGVVMAWLVLVAMLKWWRRRVTVAVLAACVLLVAAGWQRGDLARLIGGYTTGGAALSVSERTMHWRAARHMIVAHPWLGVGPGRFPVEFTQYEVIRPLRHAHNMLLHVGAETGLLALMPFVALWIRVLVRSLRAAARDLTGAAAFALHGMVAAFFIRSLSDQFLANVHSSFRTSLLVAILIGLAEASGRGTDGP